MATKSFLTQEQSTQAREFLAQLRSGSSSKPFSFAPRFSEWLAVQLMSRLSALPGWRESQPILLGSWARGELSPCSDIDILFVGVDDAISKLVEAANSQGLRLRYRAPANQNDWTVGVEAFDILALCQGRAVFDETKPLLEKQVALVQKRGRRFRRQLLSALIKERQGRNQRYDSISNYLEPNLKYGQGGLRDLLQALYVYDLFSDRFHPESHALRVLRQSKDMFLAIRQLLHLDGAGDVLVASEQSELSTWFGFKQVQEFTRRVQRELARVSFYADWMIDVARASQKNLADVAALSIATPAQAFSALEENPSILVQERVRTKVKALFPAQDGISGAAAGRLLHQGFRPDKSEEYLVALFRSRCLEELITELKPLEGLVQHDQYHRFSADAHVVQAVRELKRILSGNFGKRDLKYLLQGLDEEDARILLWTCVYHDIAKGRGGDHSTKGAEIVRKDFEHFGFSKAFTEEVAWMVENHLLLSTAAFRRNPRSPTMWKELHDRGVVGARLRRLALFTVVDIRATNPEAWTMWKSQLLRVLVETLRTERVEKFHRLLALAQKKNVRLDSQFLIGLDPALVDEVAPKLILADFQKLASEKGDLGLLVVKHSPKVFWVRFHQRHDEPGLFRDYVMRLFYSGLSVQQAYVHTLEGYGVYDWFRVTGGQSFESLKKALHRGLTKSQPLPRVRFDRIEWVSVDEKEATVSFRGRDQRGALIAAAEGLWSAGLVIRWAKVHTWGRQIDDVFGVEKPTDPDGVIASLRQKLGVDEADV